ncbi:MAG: hypothetical protein FWH20_00885, partial [Oscillospiraceae bacterium]|nr:hypothetical protein [Oscillospiraceae bacterium]
MEFGLIFWTIAKFADATHGRALRAPTCREFHETLWGAEGGSRGLCLRRRKVAASPPHKLFRLHFLDCE